MKTLHKRLLTLLLAGTLLFTTALAAEATNAEQAPVLTEVTEESETQENPALPKEPEETAEEAPEASGAVQTLDTVTTVHASDAGTLMEYLTDGARDLVITLDAHKDYVIYSLRFNSSTGASYQTGFVAENLRNVTVRGQEGTRILTPGECGGYAVITLLQCEDVTLDTLSIGHLDSWCGAPVLVLGQSQDVEVSSCSLWGCGYYGIGCNSSRFHAEDTVIWDCSGYLMDFQGGTAVFDNCTFRDNCDERPDGPAEMIAIQGAPNSAVFNDCQFLRNRNTVKLQPGQEEKFTFNRCTEEDNGWNSAKPVITEVGPSASLELTGSAAVIRGTGKVEYIPYQIRPLVTALTVESGITELGESSLGGFTALRKITLPETLTAIGRSAFSGNRSLTEIRIPSHVTELGGSAFQDCAQLAKVTLPEGIETIGSSAFLYCSRLAEINLPGSLRTIDSLAFCGCTGLERVVIPQGVTAIGSSAFSGCSNLRELVLPSSLATLEREAFASCSGLEHLTLPAEVSLPAAAFGSYDHLSLLTFTGNGPMAEVSVTMGTPWKKIQSPFTVEFLEGVTGIAGNAFQNCTSLTALRLPRSVQTIGSAAFYDCSGLAELQFSAGLTEISSSAFYGCKNLTELEIPDTVTAIGDYAFRNCTGLTSLTLPEGLETVGSYAFDLSQSYTGNLGPVSLTLPDSVASVGKSAFAGWSGLRYVSLPLTAQLSVGSTGSGAFYGCTGISQVTIRGAGDLPAMNGSGGNNGTPWSAAGAPVTVVLEEGITGIGAEFFYRCRMLSRVVLPGTLTHIDAKAFSSCEELTGLSIPGSVNSIGADAFYGSGLKDLYYGGTEADWNAAKPGTGTVGLPKDTRLHYVTTESAYTEGEVDRILAGGTLDEVHTGLAALNGDSLSRALLNPEILRKMTEKEGEIPVRTAENISPGFRAEETSIAGAKLNFPQETGLTLKLDGPGDFDIAVPAMEKTIRFSAKLVNETGTVVEAANLEVPMAVSVLLPERGVSERNVRVWHQQGGSGGTLSELRYLRTEDAAAGTRLTFLLDGFSDLIVTYDTGFSLTLEGDSVKVQDDQNTLAGCKTVLAALYDNGRLADLAAGTYDGRRISFRKELTAGYTLFFLNDARQPLRQKQVI